MVRKGSGVGEALPFFLWGDGKETTTHVQMELGLGMPDFRQMSKVVDQYKYVTLKDLYSQWASYDEVAWQQPYVKELFWELKRFIDLVLSSTELPQHSCYDFDMELMKIVDRHLGVARGAAHLQPAFVAILLEARSAPPGTAPGPCTSLPAA